MFWIWKGWNCFWYQKLFLQILQWSILYRKSSKYSYHDVSRRRKGTKTKEEKSWNGRRSGFMNHFSYWTSVLSRTKVLIGQRVVPWSPNKDEEARAEKELARAAAYPFPCEDCDKRFANFSGMKVHMKSSHKYREADFANHCDICGRKFSSQRSLQVIIASTTKMNAKNGRIQK